MDSRKFLVSAIIVFALIAGVALLFNRTSEDHPAGSIADFEDCVAAGYPVMETYPSTCKTPQGATFTQDIGNELEKLNLIQTSNPRPGQTIESPLTIDGEARGFWYFEASFPARLLDGNGKELAVAPITAQGEWMTEEFVPFKGTLAFPTPTTKHGTLVLQKDNPSGLPEHADELRIPIVFKASKASNTMKVKAYFGNSILDPAITCVKVFPVEREIPKTEAVARAATEELLKGPTAPEQEQEYGTSINPGVKIQSLAIANGTAMIDFDKKLGEAVGGSCRVAAIRAQITETLKQFSSVKTVVISIDGRTEDILQP